MSVKTDWISTTEAAKIMGVSSRTVRNYIALKLIGYRRYLGHFQVQQSEAAALAKYGDPIKKAEALVRLAKMFAVGAKFPPARFNELIKSLSTAIPEEKRETAETAETKSLDRSVSDIDSIMG